MSSRLFSIVLFFTVAFSQFSQDARMVALNGSYTTVARGYQCVGVNPANLAYSNGFSMNLLSFNYGAGNNVLSLNVMNELDDATIESEAVIDSIYANSGNPDGVKYFSLENLNYLLKDGYIATMDASIPLPILNFSFQKYAFTTSPKLFVKSGIPSGFTYFLTNGNPPDIDLSIDLPLDIMAVQETGFTYAFSKEDFSFGITAKYILGYFYSTFESVDSSYIRTNLIGSLNNEEISDDFGISGQGNFLMKQAIGGNGFGVDVGLLSKEFDNGIQFGTSVTNLFGSIKWTQNHFLRSTIEATIEESVPEEYFLRQNEFYYYHLEINSITLNDLAEKPIDEMIFKLGYKVIRVSDLGPFNLTETDPLVVIIPNKGGYLIPSTGIASSTLDSLSSEPLQTNYPSVFRLGLSKRYEEGVVVIADLSTGFSDDFGGYDNWRIAFATEITHYPIITFRTGIAFGGAYGRSMSFGTGFNIGRVYIDLGMGYREGLSANTTKGLDFSITTSIR